MPMPRDHADGSACVLTSRLTSFSSASISTIPLVSLSALGLSSSGLLLRTLLVVFDLDAFQLQPAPVQDLVGEDRDEERLEYGSSIMLVEISL